MPHSCAGFCNAAERQFTPRKARKELRRYRTRGVDSTTRGLRDALVSAGVVRGTLLDIGSGIGALTFELLNRGATTATAIDASAAYVDAASEEAKRRAVSDRVQFLHADFLDVAGRLTAASVVTLDRVVCCYPSYRPLLEASARLAETALALSYPRQRWYVRAGNGLENLMRRGAAFRTFVHPAAQMEAVVRNAGFELLSRRTSAVWAVDVFTRRPDSVRGGG